MELSTQIPVAPAALRMGVVAFTTIFFIVVELRGQFVSAYNSHSDPGGFLHSKFVKPGLATTEEDRDSFLNHIHVSQRLAMELNVSSTFGEVEALIAFKAAISSDPLRTLVSWRANDSTCCGWAGVVCRQNSNASSHHVTSLNLQGRQLVGNLTSALHALAGVPSLRRLDLSKNSFTGSLVGATLANFSSLSYLNISENQVRGEIPHQVGELARLESLDLHSNNLTGGVPSTFGNCTLLRTLNLETNFLEGHIPSALGKLANLEYLNLGTAYAGVQQRSDIPPVGNLFVGSIPTSLGNCSSLRYLNLADNPNLGGNLPQELEHVRSLQEIWLGSCKFTGAIPAWLGNHTNLTGIHLSSNQFSGEIPDTLGQLPNLEIFVVGRNNLSGVLPVTITNCTKLWDFGIEQNSISGHIPANIGLLSGMELLFLWDNSFVGRIPNSMANCSNLRFLLLGYNDLMDPHPFPSWVTSIASLEYLELDAMNVQGKIPSDIGRLSQLQSFHASGNNLLGPIPPSIANCTLLDTIELDTNQLSGEIPAEISVLTNLVYIYLYDNFLTGSLPFERISNMSFLLAFEIADNFLHGTLENSDWGKLPQLYIVDMSANQLDGFVPKSLGNCSNLLDVRFSKNRITGVIPPTLANCSLLENLDLSHNQIRGNVPRELERCSKLNSLILNQNSLTGRLLPNIGQLSSLQQVNLSHNQLTGAVPESLGNCSSILDLDLSYNNLTGSIPRSSISQLILLLSLNLSHNLFSGSWPLPLSRLRFISAIDVSMNNFSGPITLGGITGLKSLARLDVSFNQLTGAIPSSLGSLQNLTYFNASYNNFEGAIPDGGVFNSNLTETSFLGNPGLCGAEALLGPGRECLASPAPHSAPSHESCKGFRCKRAWIPTACAGAGLLFSMVGILVCCLCFPKMKLIQKHMYTRSSEVNLNFGSDLPLSAKDVFSITRGEDNNIIGVGAKSVVFKGMLPGGQMFAVKTLKKEGHGRQDNTLPHEVHILAQLRHRNLVKVFRYFSNYEVDAIVLEYMSQGSLHAHLHPTTAGTRCELPWQTRFDIAVGIAEGMKYLHNDFPEPLIHGDLKPTNILLDDNFEAKIADFGSSKFANPLKDDGEVTASKLCGTIGYMPPEYALGTHVSTKGDVYSFGVILMELLTGRSPTSNSDGRLGPNDDNYRVWILKLFEKMSSEFLDSFLKEEADIDTRKRKQMMLMMRVALFCTREIPQNRPSVNDVRSMLKQIEETGRESVPQRSIRDLANDQEGTEWQSEDPSTESRSNFSGST